MYPKKPTRVCTRVSEHWCFMVLADGCGGVGWIEPFEPPLARGLHRRHHHHHDHHHCWATCYFCVCCIFCDYQPRDLGATRSYIFLIFATLMRFTVDSVAQVMKGPCASVSLHGWGDTQWPINPPPLLSSSHSPSFSPLERRKVSQQVWNRVMN